MKKPTTDWESAREVWFEGLQRSASKEQRQCWDELNESRLLNEFEMVKFVFGWRSPAARQIWSIANCTGEKLGTHQAVEFLIRVVLGVPTDGSCRGREFQKDTKKEIQDLLIVGYENGHVLSNSTSIKDAARIAVNGTFNKLGFNVRN